MSKNFLGRREWREATGLLLVSRRQQEARQILAIGTLQ